MWFGHSYFAHDRSVVAPRAADAQHFEIFNLMRPHEGLSEFSLALLNRFEALTGVK